MMKNILLTSATCFILTLAASGQSPTPSPDASPVGYSDSDAAPPVVATLPKKPNEKAATLDELKAKAKTAKTDDDLIFRYDKFKDSSLIIAKPENLVGSWEGAAAIVGSSPAHGTGPGTPRLLMVSLQSAFAGQSLRESPDKFALVFAGMSPDWQFFKTGSTLYVLFDDDKRFALDAAARDHSVVRYNRVDESVAYVVTREQVAALVNAKKVEIRIGEARPREIKTKILKRWQSMLDITKLDPEK